MRNIFLCVAIVFLYATFFIGFTQKEEVVAAHLQKVLRASQEVQQVEQWLSKKNAWIRKNLKQRKKEIEELKKRQDALHPESEAFEKLEWEIRKKDLEMKDFVQYSVSKVKKRYQKMMQEAVKKAKKRLYQYLKKRGYEILLDLDQPGVFFCHRRRDITQELVQALQ